MTSRTRTLRADIVGDADKLERELKRANRAVKDAERQMEAFGLTTDRVNTRSGNLVRTFGGLKSAATTMAVGIGVGAAAMGAAGFAAFKLAKTSADLSEAQDAVRAVFGDSAIAVRDWAETSDIALGISERAANEAAAGVGDMLQTAGLLPAAAAEMSIAIVELASDMGSLRNQDPSLMLQRLRSGLAGEAEPLRQFGVALSAARVEQKAMELGLAATTKEIDDQDKVLARYAIIMEDSVRAQGNFADTANSLPNQLNTLNAQFENLRASLGDALLPAITDVVAELNTFLDENEEEIVRRFGEAVDGLGGAFARTATEIREAKDDWNSFINSGVVQGFLKFNEATGGILTLDPLQELAGFQSGPLNPDSAGFPLPSVGSSSFDVPRPPRPLPSKAVLETVAARMGISVDEVEQLVLSGQIVLGGSAAGVPLPDPARGGSGGSVGGGAGGSAPTAFSGAALSFIQSQISGLPDFDFDLSARGVADFEAAQQGFDDARKSLRHLAAGIGLDLAELDAVGLENTDAFAAFEAQLDAVQETLKRIDLIEDLELDPFRDAMDDLADSFREAEEASKELAAAERDRAVQNQAALIQAIMAAEPGTDTSGAQAELLRQQRTAAGLPLDGSGGVNSGGQTVIHVNGDLNVKTMEDGQMPAVAELLTQ